MPALQNRWATSLKRKKRPTTGKIIFISCEGQVTEEEYFHLASNIFSGVKNKIRVISIMEDTVKIPPKERNGYQVRELCKSSPEQLVDKIDRFKKMENDKYDFAKHPEDEFWIIADVDNHTDGMNMVRWLDTLARCDQKKYRYAVSNPFFEFWLLLHHVEPTEKDYLYAVTESQPYRKTSYFRNRLKIDAHAGLYKEKHIKPEHYNENKIRMATKRAKQLDKNENAPWPKSLGSTVYKLMEQIIEISDSM